MKHTRQELADRLSMLMYKQRHMPKKTRYNHTKIHEHIRGIEETRMRPFEHRNF